MIVPFTSVIDPILFSFANAKEDIITNNNILINQLKYLKMNGL